MHKLFCREEPATDFDYHAFELLITHFCKFEVFFYSFDDVLVLQKFSKRAHSKIRYHRNTSVPEVMLTMIQKTGGKRKVDAVLLQAISPGKSSNQ